MAVGQLGGKSGVFVIGFDAEQARFFFAGKAHLPFQGGAGIGQGFGLIALLQFELGDDAVLHALAAQKSHIHFVWAFESTATAQTSQAGQTAQAGQCGSSATLLLLGWHDHGFGGEDGGHEQAHHHGHQGGDQGNGKQGGFFFAQGGGQVEQADFVFVAHGHGAGLGVVVHVRDLTGEGF